MLKIGHLIILPLAFSLSCSSPAKVELRPNPLVLEGEGAKGQLEAVVFDQHGKQLTQGYDLTWMCPDTGTIKLRQDGTVIAQSSGKVLVVVELVRADYIYDIGTIEVKIPAWVEVSHEELHLAVDKGPMRIWAEVRSDKGMPIKGFLPTWKVDDASIVSIEVVTEINKQRTLLNVTPLTPGETYVTASYKGLASDILVTVSDRNVL